jgi:hypothetical protein
MSCMQKETQQKSMESFSFAPDFKVIQMNILLAKNPSPCSACGFLVDGQELYQLEPTGQRIARMFNTSCVKTRGWCQLEGHYVEWLRGEELKELKPYQVITTDVFTGKKTIRTQWF